MTNDQRMALEMAEDAAVHALRRHDDARKAYLVVLFSRGLEDERRKRREALREARLVLECTGIALQNAQRNAGVKTH